MPPRAAPNLFTIPASAGFLDTLADALLEDTLGLGLEGDPARLASLTLYLPSRRAARAFSAILARRAGAKALVLPRIVPLGDPDEAEMEEALLEEMDAETLDPGPIRPLRRQVILARLVRQAGEAFSVGSFADAFALGGALGDVLDAVQAQGLDLSSLSGLDATRFDVYRQNSAVLLGLLGETWQGVLDELGLCDPVAWRNRLLKRARERLAGERPRLDDGPVVVAGSTGSMPVTAALIRAVAWRPDGAVILPDLDLEASEADWRAIAQIGDDGPDRHAAHPQALLARLIGEIGAGRDGVRALGEPGASRAARRRLVHEALRPAATTPDWRSLPERLDTDALAHGFAGVRIAEAANAQEEALVVALAIREAIQTPERTVALVTPDRALAERVGIELGRWGIAVEDSAGQPLSRTQAGSLAMAVLDLAEHGLSGARLAALIGHPRLRLGRSAPEARRSAQALLTAALPGQRFAGDLGGWLGLIEALPDITTERHAIAPVRRLSAENLRGAMAFGRDLGQALGPLLKAERAGHAELARRLREALATLASDGDNDDRTAQDSTTQDGGGAFSGSDGEALATLLDELEAALEGLPGQVPAFAHIVRTALHGVVVRPRRAGHPRISVLGLIEARLMQADLVILSGLNEDTWPGPGLTDPFLNRAMRAELGLPSPERRIGQTAHDFAFAFAAPEVLLTRAARSGEAQSIASRFWLRLRSVAPEALWRQASARGEALIAIARALDQPARLAAAARPRPRPPAQAQPSSYSVTEVETLFRDPYAIYARKVLGLDLVPELDGGLDARDRGDLLHAVMERLAQDWPFDADSAGEQPEAVEAHVRALGEAVFRPLFNESEVSHFWWPRFLRMAPQIAAWETQRRRELARVDVEMRAAVRFDLPDGGTVSLSGRADRIEQWRDGRLAILDFKTGNVPSPKQIQKGLAPQLFLEAALARRAAFVATDAEGVRREIGPGAVGEAAYVALRADAATELKTTGVIAAEALAGRSEEHLQAFLAMVAQFRGGDRPFVSRHATDFMRRAGDYDHLARVDEWRVESGGDDGDG